MEELRGGGGGGGGGGIAKLHKVINCNQKQSCPAAEVGAQRKKKGHTPRRLTRVDPLLPPSTISRRSPAERLEVEREAIQRGCFSSSSQMSDSSSLFNWCTTISLSICRVSRILSPEGDIYYAMRSCYPWHAYTVRVTLLGLSACLSTTILPLQATKRHQSDTNGSSATNARKINLPMHSRSRNWHYQGPCWVTQLIN